jgi:histidine triad (HIT) family protein
LVGQCEFCRLISSPSDRLTVSVSDHALTVMDSSPLAPGHLLVIPLDHIEDVLTAPVSILEAMIIDGHSAAKVIKDRLGAASFTLFLNSGEVSATQHLHLHVIPRWPGDGLAMWPAVPAPREEQVSLHAVLTT